MPRVILIEDDALVRKLLEKCLIASGWDVLAMKDGRDLHKQVQRFTADLLLIDMGLPYIDGLSLVESLRARGINTPVMMLTAYDLPHLRATVHGSGANDLVQKPYDQEELLRRMERLLAA